MKIGDIITTKLGAEIRIEKIGINIIVGRDINWVDKSRPTAPDTDVRIVSKKNIVFNQLTLF